MESKLIHVITRDALAASTCTLHAARDRETLYRLRAGCAFVMFYKLDFCAQCLDHSYVYTHAHTIHTHTQTHKHTRKFKCVHVNTCVTHVIQFFEKRIYTVRFHPIF